MRTLLTPPSRAKSKNEDLPALTATPIFCGNNEQPPPTKTVKPTRQHRIAARQNVESVSSSSSYVQEVDQDARDNRTNGTADNAYQRKPHKRSCETQETADCFGGYDTTPPFCFDVRPNGAPTTRTLEQIKLKWRGAIREPAT
jgi:hypothetical protein